MSERKAYLPFDYTAFFLDTVHLKDDEKILYLEMVCFQFEHEKGFESAEKACLLLGKTKHNVRKIQRILDEFFTQMPDNCEAIDEQLNDNCLTIERELSHNWWQKRVRLEIDKRRQKQLEGRIHVQKRWSKTDRSPNTGKVSKGKVSNKKEKIEKEKENAFASQSADDFLFVSDEENSKSKIENLPKKPEPAKQAQNSQGGSVPKRQKAFKNSGFPCPKEVKPQVWRDFQELRRQKRAPLSQTAIEGLRREAKKAGMTLESAIETCVLRGWQGFRADWLKNDQGGSVPNFSGKPPPTGYSNDSLGQGKSDLNASFYTDEELEANAKRT